MIYDASDSADNICLALFPGSVGCKGLGTRLIIEYILHLDTRILLLYYNKVQRGFSYSVP